MNIEKACDRFDRASEYFYAKKYKRALKTFEEIESQLVNDDVYGDTLIFLIASCHYFLRKFDKALPYIEKVQIRNINIKLVKLYLRIYFFTHVHLNQYEQMTKVYTEIINSEIDGQIKGYSYFYLGYIKQEQELFEEALNQYNKYVLLVPESSINYSNIAYCFFKLDEYDRADTYIQKAINQYENRIFELVLAAEIHRVLYGEEPAYELMYKAILKEQSKIIDKSLLLTPMEEHFLQTVMEYYKKEKDNIEKSIIGKSSVKINLPHPQKASISHNQVESKIIQDEGIEEPITEKPKIQEEQPIQNQIKLQVNQDLDNQSEIIPVEQQVVREIAVSKNQMALRGKHNQQQNERLNTLNPNNELKSHHDENDLISFQSMHCQKTIPFIKHQATHSNAQTPEMRNQDNQFLKFDDESKASQARQFFPGSQSSQPIRFDSLVSKSDVIKGSQTSLKHIETPTQKRAIDNRQDGTPGFQTPQQF